MLIDLHVHSTLTPGCSLDMEAAVRRAEEAGLDGVCFTDRNTFRGAPGAHALRAKTRLKILVGAEVETDHGYYLCFLPSPETAQEPEELFEKPLEGERFAARNVVETVRRLGGAVVAAHPYERHIEKPAGDYIFTLKGLTAIEGITGTKKSNVNELAIEAAEHLSVPCVGGSAALGSYDEIGTAATLFRDPIENEAQLVAALAGGAVWAVSIGTPPTFYGDTVVRREGRSEPRHERREERRDERGGGRRQGGRGRGRGRGRHHRGGS